MGKRIYITGSSVTKNIGSRLLFANLSFSVQAGECLAITGANGSGKSTLLKLIAGTIHPSSGVIKFSDGSQVLDEEARTLCLGLVSPEMQMYEMLTGIENIRLLAEARGLKLSNAQAVDCCERMGLGVKSADLVKTYSTGMRQRLKIALLLAVDVPVWLLDEPSSNLDNTGRQIISGAIAAAVKEGRSIVLATNDEAEAVYAQRTIALS